MENLNVFSVLARVHMAFSGKDAAQIYAAHKATAELVKAAKVIADAADLSASTGIPMESNHAANVRAALAKFGG